MTHNKDNFFTQKNIDNKNYISQNPKILHFKKLAKKLYKENKNSSSEKFSLTHFHDVVAMQYGYKHWHEFHTNIKSLYTKQYDLNYIFSGNLDIPSHMPKNSNPLHIGYEENLYMNLWLNEDLLKNHLVIAGNNTERDTILKNIARQKIKQNNHMVFVTGDKNKSNELINYAKEHKREKDIRYISFLRDNELIHSWNQKTDIDTNYFSFFNNFGTKNFKNFLSSFYKDYDTEHSTLFIKIKDLFINFLSIKLNHKYSHKKNSQDYLTIDLITEESNLINIYNSYINKEHVDTYPQLHSALEEYLFSLPGFNINLPFEKQIDSFIDHHSYILIPLLQHLYYLKDNFKYYYQGADILDFDDINANNKNLLYFIEVPCAPESIHSLIYHNCLLNLLMIILDKNNYSRYISYHLSMNIGNTLEKFIPPMMKSSLETMKNKSIQNLELRNILLDGIKPDLEILKTLVTASNSRQQFVFSYPNFQYYETRYVGHYIIGKSILDDIENVQHSDNIQDKNIYFMYQNQYTNYYLQYNDNQMNNKL